MQNSRIDEMLSGEGIGECFEIGCQYASTDPDVNWQNCMCPTIDEHNCPRLPVEAE